MKFLPKTVDSQFLVRVIRNEVGPEEREFFQKWLEHSEENKEEFSSLLLLWDKFQNSHLPALPSQQEQWEKIETIITSAQNNNDDSVGLSFPQYKSSFSDNKQHYRQTSSKYSWIYRVAAVIIIGITLFLLGESVQKNQPEKTVINTGPAPRIKYYTLSTAKGEKATLSLSDGSTIQLNAESKLRYPNYFDNDSREVEFEGEGYFKINPDKNRPFRVKCNNTITEVTGTEFNIRNRGEGISITVVEGSVRTFSSRSAEGVPIIKGQMVTLKNTGSFSSPVRVNLRHTTAWRENKISFAKTPLYEAADELERIYNSIDIVIISDSLKNKTISGIFDTNSLEDILSILSLTLDIKVNRDGKKIYFE